MSTATVEESIRQDKKSNKNKNSNQKFIYFLFQIIFLHYSYRWTTNAATP